MEQQCQFCGKEFDSAIYSCCAVCYLRMFPLYAQNDDYVIIHRPDGTTRVNRDGVMSFEPTDDRQKGDEERVQENWKHYYAISGD